MDEKVLRTSILKMKLEKPLTKITIGDEMYLDEIANGTDTGCQKKLVFDEKFRGMKFGKIKIEEIQWFEDKYDGFIYKITIAAALEERIINTYIDGKWYGKKTENISHELGCDTASFIIETNYGYEEFHTGADGYYGHADKFKTPYGILITLELDGDMFSYEDVINRMKYLFDAEEV